MALKELLFLNLLNEYTSCTSALSQLYIKYLSEGIVYVNAHHNVFFE